MVILSAGLKGISIELLEAARVDGANEVQVFRRIILPLLAPTIAVVATTIIIYALKTFDVVYTMTNGNFNTNVIANLMYQQLFNSGQRGRAAAVAVILLLAIVPVMDVNIRRFRAAGGHPMTARTDPGSRSPAARRSARASRPGPAPRARSPAPVAHPPHGALGDPHGRPPRRLLPSGGATNTSGWWTAITPPWEFTLDNYQYVLGRAGIDQAFVNSFIITIPATVLVVMVAAFAAYAFAWMEFPGRNILFVIVVGLLVVPLQVTLIPVLTLFRDFTPAGFKINGTMLAVWLAHTGYGLPFAIYLLRNYFGGLPREVFESAAIDGASPSTSFFRLALPMSVPPSRR